MLTSVVLNVSLIVWHIKFKNNRRKRNNRLATLEVVVLKTFGWNHSLIVSCFGTVKLSFRLFGRSPEASSTLESQNILHYNIMGK